MTGFVYYTILRAIIKHYNADGYEIVTGKDANYSEDIAALCHGYRPDVVAFKNGLYSICDVQTSETIDLPETIKRWVTISRSDYPLHIAVPLSIYTYAASLAKGHSIKVERWWTAPKI